MTKPPELKIDDHGLDLDSWVAFLNWCKDNGMEQAEATQVSQAIKGNAVATAVAVRSLIITGLEFAYEAAKLKMQVGEMSKSIGRVLERGAVKPEEFHMLVKAKAADGHAFELGICKSKGNAPSVFSTQTGKLYFLDWNELASLAVRAGVCNQDIIA